MKIVNFLRSHKLLVFLVLVFICAFVLTGTVKCEILTRLHKYEFSDPKLYTEHTMIDPAPYVKVIEYSKERAVVYYIGISGLHGDTVSYKKDNGQWKFDGWGTVWSIYGSADSALKPYWWHYFTKSHFLRADLKKEYKEIGMKDYENS